jgi:MIP family channel proteins
MKGLVPGCVAEFLGTFALVFFGAGAIIVTHSNPSSGAGLITVALAHGLILAIAITGAMYISGGQFNPAVSVALIVAGKQTPAKAVVFIVVQLFAAACAAGLLQLLLTPAVANHEVPKLGATIGDLTLKGNIKGVFGFEFILTFFLMFAVLMGTVDERAHKLGGFVIGLTVTACILAAGPLTGASMNPARTFGPAMCGDRWTSMWWVYWAAPIAGACAAGAVYKAFWKKT